MKRPPLIPRCGCCDALDPLALCEDCGEGMCARHLESIRRQGDLAFICTICREAAESHTQQPAPLAVGAA